MIRLVYGVLVLGSTIWVTSDASRLGAHKGATGGGFLDMGPVGWFFACFFLWIIAFPCYLFHRAKLKAARERPLSAWGYPTAPAPPAWPYGPPPPQAPAGPWLNGYVPPPPPQQPPWASPAICQRCGTQLGGPFCSTCGSPAPTVG